MNKKNSLIIIVSLSVIAAIGIGVTMGQPKNLLIADTVETSEPRPGPPPEPISDRGEKHATFTEAAKSRDWIKEPTYLPEEYSLKEIRSNNEQGTGFEVLAVFGRGSMEVRDTVQDNVSDEIVISYFVDGVSIDWKEHVDKMVAQQPDTRSQSLVDGVLIYTTESKDGINRAYYREDTNTWVVMSSVESVDELAKILRSTIRSR